MRARKRTAVFVNCQKELNPTEQVRRLKHFSDTRWTSHGCVIDVIHLKYKELLKTLSILKESNDRVTASTAKSLIITITTFEFVLSMILLKNIFNITTPLSNYLQSKSLDFIQALKLVDSCKVKLRGMRSEEDCDSIINEAKLFARTHKLDDDLPSDFKSVRIKKKKMPGENTQDQISESPIERYRKNTFYKVLDQIIMSINSRFSDAREILKDLCLLSPERLLKFSKEKKPLPVDCFNYISNWVKGIDTVSLRLEYIQFSSSLSELLTGLNLTTKLHGDNNKSKSNYNELLNANISSNDDGEEINDISFGKGTDNIINIETILHVLSNYTLVAAFPNLYQTFKALVQSHNGHKRPYHMENSNEAANAKKTRMTIVKTPGFVKTGTSLSNKIIWYYKKNTYNLTNYRTFLESIKKDLIQLLKLLSTKHPIKFNLKLEATYSRPNVENSAENRAFKTSAKEIFMDTDIDSIVEQAFVKLLAEEDVYTSKGSSYTLEAIDGLLLGVYNYTPMGNNKNLVAENYTSLEDKFNFDGLTYPTPTTKIKIFEKNNLDVSVNVFGLKHEKNKKYIIFPLKVVDEEKKDHFDLLLITDGDKSHYTFISNFSHLVRARKTSHTENVFCKRCFTSFDNQPRKNTLSGQAALAQTLCNSCNLKLQQPNFVPVFLHNLTNYDAHFLITELGYDTNTISVIPNSEEKFISFSKYINNTFTIRFIDTLRFMASSLSSLASNLLTSDFEKFRETSKHFSSEDMPLVTRKGVYPYEYINSLDKLKETHLPEKEDLYSALTKEYIKEEDYIHAKAVWKHFSYTTLGEYSDLYLKIDVLLLADVFENFRDLYCLFMNYVFNILVFTKGIRGGLTQASMRYAKASNHKVPDHDETKPKSWLVYQDCNNLYGWAMSQYMPYGGFKWVEHNLEGLDDFTETSPIYEVDISYPKELHNLHNDLPFYHKTGFPKFRKCKN
ncbi:hypothetical protein QTP88_025786 [Uroleucon formosanum]